MRADEIGLASFPFGDVPGMKLRPVLLLTDRLGPVPEVLVAYISSVMPPALLPTDIVIDPSQGEHTATHLKTVSVLRLHKLATIHARNIVRKIGRLSQATSAEVNVKLRSLLEL